MGEFGVGQALSRLEDDRLLSGGGEYTDDVHPDGAAFSAVVRSPFAHAEISGIDLDEAKAVPGVLAIYTVEDLDAAGINDIPCLTPMRGKDGAKPVMPGHPILARGRVRHVGDPIAFVVAETKAAAEEAAELVAVDYDDLPAVVETGEAMSEGAPQIWPDAPNNLCLHWQTGDKAAMESAFEKAERVVEVELVNNRIVVNSMEGRNAVGEYDAEAGRYILTTSSQGVHKVRDQLADHIFAIDRDKVRVKTPDVGGGFGMKLFMYSEQILVLFAARQLGRPVRWTASRSEDFLSDSQGRDHVSRARLAMTADGRFLGLDVDTTANLGAYLSNFSVYVATDAGAKMLSGLYRFEGIYAQVKCVFTNTVPVDAYRGAGRPEAAYLLERLVDKAARELGTSPDALRAKNFIPPEAMPYDTGLGLTYDSGEFEHVMRQAMENADWQGAAQRKEEARKAGKLRGIGMASYVEACGGIGEEEARFVLDPDGGVTLYVGTQSNGQGHATAYAQVIAERIGIDPGQVRLRQGDSDEIEAGGGTGGSRSLLMGRLAIEGATDKAIEKMKAVAGHLLEVAPADIELADGVFTVVGTDQRKTLAEIARAIDQDKESLPEELRENIDEMHHASAPGMTFPNGCHICELDIDEATGVVTIDRYTVVDDFGTLVNPKTAAGQVHGGIGQGLGQALLEHTAYDETGQLVTGSFMDYAMPRADDFVQIDLQFVEVPCATNPFGIKGAGEAGAIGAPPAIINAIVDALSPLGVEHIDMPATPLAVWRAIQTAKQDRKAAAE